MAKKLSKKSQEFIAANKAKHTPDELAEQLGLDVKQVEDILDVYANVGEGNVQWKEFLRKSPDWKILKKQFTDEEMDKFTERFCQLMGQFKDDVLPSEMIQIFHLIQIDLLRDRNLQSKRRAEEQVHTLEALQNAIVDKCAGDFTKLTREDRDSLAEYGRQIAGFSAGEANASKEFNELQKSYNDILKQLKGVREQRVERATNAKNSFTDLVKSLQERDVQEMESRQLQLFQQATKKETVRLGSPHTYIDGSIDLPLLSADTIEAYEVEEKRELETKPQENEKEGEGSNE